MKHYRILEKKGNRKEYTIQYLKSVLFGFHFWRNINQDRYHKYEDALTEVKKIIKQDDYETVKFGYHYIDAYKIFKSQTLKK